ncbi:hypothetical protein EMIT0232MI5_10520 [Pseudomonas sp. IT-232MI5]
MVVVLLCQGVFMGSDVVVGVVVAVQALSFAGLGWRVF